MTRTCTVAGHTYEIPDIWLMGAARTFGSIEAAIRHWHAQELMSRSA